MSSKAANHPATIFMNPELERVKNDIATIQKAIGLAPCFGRDWIHWLQRDTWLYLLWGFPGLILIVAAIAPPDDTRRYFGLIPIQWVGVLVAAVMLGILAVVNRQMSADDGRPPGLVREYRRINASSWTMLVPILFYFIWARQYGIGAHAFMAGLWLLCGSIVFMAALLTKLWVFLGWAIPLLAFGLCQPLIHGKGGGVWFGVMFIAVAVLSSAIQTWHLRRIEKQHDAD